MSPKIKCYEIEFRASYLAVASYIASYVASYVHSFQDIVTANPSLSN